MMVITILRNLVPLKITRHSNAISLTAGRCNSSISGGWCSRSMIWLPAIVLFMFSNNVCSQPPAPGARGFDQIQRPGQIQLPPGEPDYEAPDTIPALELPPLPQPPESRRPADGLQILVHSFTFEGNTVVSDDDLNALVAPYEGRLISTSDLLHIRDLISFHYIKLGYLNSGALIPDQDVIDGIIRLKIIEGVIVAIDITGNQWVRNHYLDRRLRLGIGPPLNINDLQQQLQILQENPLVGSINAYLDPGRVPGKSRLDVTVKENRPYHLSVSANNHRPPSVGAEQLVIYAEHLSLTGNGDALRGAYNLTDGLDNYFFSYSHPVSPRDVTIGFHYDRTDSVVVEEPFEDLNIEGDARTLGMSISYPLYRAPGEQFGLSLTLEKRSSDTTLLDAPFSFAPGVKEGSSDVTPLRLSLEWMQRQKYRALVARSVFTYGLDIFGATRNDNEIPDGDYIAWLGQFQWAQRLGEANAEILFRTDAQLAADSLLPLEQFVVGGAQTVRGYRENQLVRDNGLIVSVEGRIPVYAGEGGRTRLRAAVFGDYGRSWNTDLESPSPKNISSVGIGLLFDLYNLHGQVYFAHPFKDIDNDDRDHDLQDDGIHFQVGYSVF